jgi:hypothetical protein
MSGSDRGHDRQPEPAAAVRAHARGIGAAKSFEGVRQELGRKARPVVSDLDRQYAPRAAAATVAGHFARIGGHLDDAAIRGMPDRIVDGASSGRRLCVQATSTRRWRAASPAAGRSNLRSHLHSARLTRTRTMTITRWPLGASEPVSSRSRGRARWLRPATHVAVQPGPRVPYRPPAPASVGWPA